MYPPGWYPDPQTPGQTRWWDGEQWTEHVNQATTPGYGPWSTPVAPAKAPRTGVVLLISLAIVVVLVLLAAGAIVGLRAANQNRRAPAPPVSKPGSPPGTTNGRTDLERQAGAAGVAVLGAEGAATHTHTLLLITVDGRPVKVPAHIGIDEANGQIAVLHTHNTSGIIHVESVTMEDSYTVGQFLTLADLADDKALCARFATEPCRVEIAVVSPSADDHEVFSDYGRMPDEPPINAAGRDTRLAQGAVIEIRITTSN